MLATISVGGVLGAVARFGVSSAFPHPDNHFPWATFGVNVSGCLLIGVLMVLAHEVWADNGWLRPFLGVGVLGGFTTFSTYIVDIQAAVAAGATRTALLYLVGTLAGAMLAVSAGAALTGRTVRAMRRPRLDERGTG